MSKLLRLIVIFLIAHASSVACADYELASQVADHPETVRLLDEVKNACQKSSDFNKKIQYTDIFQRQDDWLRTLSRQLLLPFDSELPGDCNLALAKLIVFLNPHLRWIGEPDSYGIIAQAINFHSAQFYLALTSGDELSVARHYGKMVDLAESQVRLGDRTEYGSMGKFFTNISVIARLPIEDSKKLEYLTNAVKLMVKHTDVPKYSNPYSLNHRLVLFGAVSEVVSHCVYPLTLDLDTHLQCDDSNSPTVVVGRYLAAIRYNRFGNVTDIFRPQDCAMLDRWLIDVKERKPEAFEGSFELFSLKLDQDDPKFDRTKPCAHLASLFKTVSNLIMNPAFDTERYVVQTKAIGDDEYQVIVIALTFGPSKLTARKEFLHVVRENGRWYYPIPSAARQSMQRFLER